MRKASVFCLVALHGIVGEEVLFPYLADLSGTKVRFVCDAAELFPSRAACGSNLFCMQHLLSWSVISMS